MKSSDFSLLVVGAGAVGGITASLLKKNGINVEIVCKYDDYAMLVSEKGINVKGVCGDFTVKIPAYASISQVKEQKDIVLLATKATEMYKASNELKAVIKENGYLISMQNGICEDDIASIIGKNKVIGCVTGWGATMDSPGNLIMTSTGDFILGYPEKDPDDFLNTVSDVLSYVVPVRTTGNIMGHLYSKLIINSCITSLGAVCGLYLGKMLSIPKIRRIFIEIIREAMIVADGMNLNVEIFGGRMDFEKFLKGNGLVSDIRRHIVIMVIGNKYKRLKSSSLQSLERGKPTEIDYLNGYIVRNGSNLGLPTPVNEFIVNMIHEIENNTRTISLENFNDPFFNRFNQRR
jgi:2-dehydropantoate 2-reductase